MFGRLILKVGFLSTIFLGSVFLSCIGPQDYGDLIQRDVEDIRDVWSRYNESGSGSIYNEAPSWKDSTFEEGSLDIAFKSDAISSIRFARYLAGVSGYISMDPFLGNRAQKGAFILNLSNFSHFPDSPDGMPLSFYNSGSKALESSTLCNGWDSLTSSIKEGVLRCDGLENLLTVKHRRLLLDPSLFRVGFGFVNNKSVITLEKNESSIVDYDLICWPSPGVFPREFFDADDPWSVSFNPEYYYAPSEKVTVKIIRSSDSRIWELDSSLGFPNDGNAFLNVDETNSDNVLVFRPPVEDLLDSNGVSIIKDKYTIIISNLRKKNGDTGNINYSITFFDLDPDYNDLSPSKVDGDSKNQVL